MRELPQPEPPEREEGDDGGFAELLKKPAHLVADDGLPEAVRAAPPKPPAKLVAHREYFGWRIDAEIVRRTEKGVLLKNGDTEMWFPAKHVYGATDDGKRVRVSSWIMSRRADMLECRYRGVVNEYHRIEQEYVWDNPPRRGGSFFYPDVE